MAILKRYGEEKVVALAEIDTYNFTICKADIFNAGIIQQGQRKITSFKAAIHKAIIAQVAFSEITIDEFTISKLPVH